MKQKILKLQQQQHKQFFNIELIFLMMYFLKFFID